MKYKTVIDFSGNGHHVTVTVFRDGKQVHQLDVEYKTAGLAAMHAKSLATTAKKQARMMRL